MVPYDKLYKEKAMKLWYVTGSIIFYIIMCIM